MGALEGWTGALAFTGQIYADFSGYTDIAIGVALLLGFVLRGMHAPAVASDITPASVLTLLLVTAGLLLCHGASALAERTGLQRRPVLLWPAVATCMAVAIAIGTPGQSFIYFQF